MRSLPCIAAACAAVFLAGCATLSPDGGLGSVAALTKTRVAQEPVRASGPEDRARIATSVRERLARPLSADDAVGIAVLNNPGLQAAYAELGIAEADLVQAGRMRNPGFSFGKFRKGDEREIERRFTIDVVGLVTMPWRIEAERGMYAAAQSRTAGEVVRVADEARRAWVEAVAAAELATYAERVEDGAAASAELARAMLRAGNFSRLAQSREQLFHADAVTQLARARHAQAVAREKLVRVLGLWGADLEALKLPDRLPDPPQAARDVADAEATAIANRLDVQAAKREAEAVARSLGLTRATRFVNVLHLGYERTTSNEAPRKTGYEVELEIPLFDWGDAKAARAEATYLQSAIRHAETAIRARSEVREAWHAYRTAHDLAKHYRESIVPLRARIAEENVLRYNGMLIGVFELLADARGQVAAVMASIEAARDFWIADADLEMALMTGSPAGVPGMRPAAAREGAPAGAH